MKIENPSTKCSLFSGRNGFIMGWCVTIFDGEIKTRANNFLAWVIQELLINPIPEHPP